jgi:hypothetical protein
VDKGDTGGVACGDRHHRRDAAAAARGVVGAEVPAFLNAIWECGAKWTRIRDSYDCFGLNIVPPSEIGKADTSVFGDEGLREEWAEDHGEHSAGSSLITVDPTNILFCRRDDTLRDFKRI